MMDDLFCIGGGLVLLLFGIAMGRISERNRRR
jgi:hypothetical protein